VKADEEKIPAASEKKVNLCLDEKQDRALKLLQLSCTVGIMIKAMINIDHT